jgi:SAM-dependent methyltransferase
MATHQKESCLYVGTERETLKMSIVENFKKMVKNSDDMKVIELGTKRWRTEHPTHHMGWFPGIKRENFIMVDIEDGIDVDVVADAHKLSEKFAENSVDAIVACSVFEHLEKPWVVAKEFEKVLKKGGAFFIQTHQTFPLHAYPSDYFRFSDLALKSLFEWATNVETEMEFPCQVMSERCPSTQYAAAFLNSCITGVKPGKDMTNEIERYTVSYYNYGRERWKNGRKEQASS